MYFLKTTLRKVTKFSQQFAANLRASRLKKGTLFFQIVQRQASGLDGGEGSVRDGDPVRGKRAASESDSSQLLGDVERKECAVQRLVG